MVLRAHETVADSVLETQLEELGESDLDDEEMGGAELEDDRVATPPPEEKVVQVTEEAPGSEELLVPQSPPARNPRRLSERPPPLQEVVIEEAETATEEKEPEEEEADKKEEPEEDLGLYILQPRTYTPVPPSPLPSPRVFDRAPRPMDDRPVSKVEPRKPRESTLSIAVNMAKEPRREPMSPISPRSPTFDQAQLRRQPSKARLVSIGARAPARKLVAPKVEVMPPEREIPLPAMEPPVPKLELPSLSMLEDFPVPKMEAPPPRRMEAPALPKVEAPPIPVMAPPPLPTIEPPSLRPQAPRPKPEVTALPEPAREPEPEVLPRQRSSLRQRVSLKNNLPESIQVPPPNPLQLHRPMYAASPRKHQAPDSAYGSDLERAPAKSTVPSIPDFPIPSPRPMLVPSPHSDLQFFRHVQASPHSPLQQRPHTSGNASSRGHPPPRNIPSAMGMSMLSNMTSATQDSMGSQQTLKKKRSAFGWLKKAFSLDEEERQAFEQKKRDQQRNLYYDGRSPKFLDGKRIQPPRRPETQYQPGY